MTSEVQPAAGTGVAAGAAAGAHARQSPRGTTSSQAAGTPRSSGSDQAVVSYRRLPFSFSMYSRSSRKNTSFIGTCGSNSARASRPAGWSSLTSTVPGGRSRTAWRPVRASVTMPVVPRSPASTWTSMPCAASTAARSGRRPGWRASGNRTQARQSPVEPRATASARAARWSAMISTRRERSDSRFATDDTTWCSTAWANVRSVPSCLRTVVPAVRDIS